MGDHIFKGLSVSGMGFVYADVLRVADELRGRQWVWWPTRLDATRMPPGHLR